LEGAVRDKVEYDLHLHYRWAVGDVAKRFFEGLKQRKILGTKCPKCKRVLVPARTFCPRCFVKTSDWLEVGQRGNLRTFTIINFRYPNQVREPPYIVGIIELEGADTGFVHYIGGVDLTDLEKAAQQLALGVKVEAVWREARVGDILDIEHFKPISG